MAIIIEFDDAEFRFLFPAFANLIEYPEVRLQSNWDIGTCYISDVNCGVLNGKCRKYALNLMTAHITAIGDIVNGGEDLTIASSASIDKVSVSVSPPNTPDGFKWWLNTTPYGAQLLALLRTKSAGGLYFGGLPESSSFRRVGGVFV